MMGHKKVKGRRCGCGGNMMRYADAKNITSSGREIVITYWMCPYCGARVGVVRDYNTREVLTTRTVKREPGISERVHPPTLCWDCQRAAGPVEQRCSWSLDLRPVAGWDAEPSEDIEGSYYVRQCPLFVRDEPRKATAW